MRFTQDSAGSINLVRAYNADGLVINADTYRGAVIVSASDLIALPDVHTLEALVEIEPARVLALEPELLLLGTGPRQVFPPVAFNAQFLQRGVGVEVMDSGAACRTYNVLIAEQRRAVAMLLV
jgi:uncharacterized protein